MDPASSVLPSGSASSSKNRLIQKKILEIASRIAEISASGNRRKRRFLAILTRSCGGEHGEVGESASR